MMIRLTYEWKYVHYSKHKYEVRCLSAALPPLCLDLQYDNADGDQVSV